MDFMFSIPLFRFRVPDWKEGKRRILAALPEFTDEYLSPEGDSYTDYYLNNEGKSPPAYQPAVTKALAECLAEFSDAGYPDVPRITQMWFEKSLHTNYHGAHTHGALGYSAVLFLSSTRKPTQPPASSPPS